MTAPAPVPVSRLFVGGHHGSEALSRGPLQMVGLLLDWGAGGTDRQLSKMSKKGTGHLLKANALSCLVRDSKSWRSVRQVERP